MHVRVIDKLSAPTTQSRAIGVHGRSMDMFDRMGIADQLIATGIKTIAFQRYSGHKPLGRIPLNCVDAAFPFMLTTAQTETGRILGFFIKSHHVPGKNQARRTRQFAIHKRWCIKCINDAPGYRGQM